MKRSIFVVCTVNLFLVFSVLISCDDGSDNNYRKEEGGYIIVQNTSKIIIYEVRFPDHNYGLSGGVYVYPNSEMSRYFSNNGIYRIEYRDSELPIDSRWSTTSVYLSGGENVHVRIP